MICIITRSRPNVNTVSCLSIVQIIRGSRTWFANQYSSDFVPSINLNSMQLVALFHYWNLSRRLRQTIRCELHNPIRRRSIILDGMICKGSVFPEGRLTFLKIRAQWGPAVQWLSINTQIRFPAGVVNSFVELESITSRLEKMTLFIYCVHKLIISFDSLGVKSVQMNLTVRWEKMSGTKNKWTKWWC